MTRIEHSIRMAVVQMELTDLRERERVCRNAKYIASADALKVKIERKAEELAELSNPKKGKKK
jgi:hypothetical protein